jgi:hypothetical protein
MRLAIKVFSVILVLYILSILFVPSVKAGCGFNSYYQCTGTCSCICGGSCYCGVNQWGHCVPLGCNTNCCQYNCRKYSCNSNEDQVSGSCAGTDMVCCKPKPQPTNTPQPTKESASSTPRPPTATPAPCNSTNDCVGYCAGIPNCSAACINGYCVFTNPTINNSQCNTWGNWSGCISGQDACGGCAAQGYTCQTRFCTDPSNANLYQISCGCSQQPGGGSANPTNTPTPIPNPSSVCDPFSPKKT